MYKKLKQILASTIIEKSIMMSVTTSMSQLIPHELYHAAGLYLFWSLLHMASSQYYSTYCANWSFWGWVSGGINALSPLCRFSLWLQQTTSNNFNSFWVGTTTWLMGKYSSFTYRTKSI